MEKPRTLTLELLENGRVAVAFPYNDEVISRLRALADRKWDPEKRRWEVSIAHLGELLDIFHVAPTDVDKRLYRAYQMYRIRHGRARISAGNIEAAIAGVNLPLERIDRHLSFHIPGYKFMTRYKKGTWDGKRHLFSMKKCTFPAGLSCRVAKIIREAGIDCDIHWSAEPDGDRLTFPRLISRETEIAASKKRARKPSNDGPAPEAPATTPAVHLELREYQQKCIDVALEHRRGVIEIATGGGKTLIAANLIRQIARPTLFLVHTLDLLHQTIAVFERELGVPVGIAGDGRIELKPITVATLQTCAHALDIKIDQSPDDDELLETDKTDVSHTAEDLQRLIRQVPVVFFDECHHLPADTAYSLAMEMENACWRFGLSATPYRADRQDMLMEAALGPKIYSARASTLIDLGYLVPPHIQFIPVPQISLKTGRVEYQDVYSDYVIENRGRNKLIVEQAQALAAEKKSVLILVSQVRHGEILREMLHGVPLVQGADPADERHRVFDALDRKEHLIVIATTLADEGLDVPSLDGVILASAGRSPTRALQRIGRALRKAPGKESAVVIDFLDNAPYLREHAANRLEIFRTEPRFILKY